MGLQPLRPLRSLKYRGYSAAWVCKQVCNADRLQTYPVFSGKLVADPLTSALQT